MLNIDKILLNSRDNIFGVKEVTESDTKNLELRYKMNSGKRDKSNYLEQRVFRDKDGNYFMEVKGGAAAAIGPAEIYHLDGRDVIIPVRPEALATWAERNLYGEEYACALEEFKAPEVLNHETVWKYQQGVKAGQQGYIYEFLWKVTSRLYMLFSTDAFYPYQGYNTPYIEFDKGGTHRDDLYLYYITPETARRWAEARGMGEAACQMVFEH